ncbi:Integrase catalytic core protein [Phytophthora palmivora]|uniref:Integrase catalytic core protein n=1 Tax=Phytophthora palmivora TaxID=4796 RepID=A0A2P4WZI8_9STRA|nr:Integrase catalytic core protein [Phytophthora palmivora]
MVELFFEYFSTVDVHDHYRQGSLEIEREWLTHSWAHKIFGTVLGMVVVDSYLAYRYEKRESNGGSDLDDTSLPVHTLLALGDRPEYQQLKIHLNEPNAAARRAKAKGYMSSLTLTNISCDRECDSNLLSAYYLAKQEYRHFQSKSEDFFSNLLFAAVAIGEVYYLPVVKLSKRSAYSAKPSKISDMLKEWHLRLGHVGKERLIRAISNRKIEGLPDIPNSELKTASFFCKTCAHMKTFPFKVHRIRTDGGTEFINAEVATLCSKLGLEFQSSNVEPPGENGSAERSHQTMMAVVRCALRGANMSAKWWPEALLYIVDITNRLPMARLGMKTPYELLYRKNPARKDPKLGDRAIKCKLLGFLPKYKGYRLLEVKANKYLIARDVTGTEATIRRSFPIEDSSTVLEEVTIIQNLGKRSKRDLEVEVTAEGAAIGSDTVTRPPKSQAVGVQSGVISDNRRSKRQRTPNVRLKDFVTQLNAVASDTSRILILRSIMEARTSLHARQWECAIKTEYEALLSNNTWTIVPLPTGRKALGRHWLLDVKYKADGSKGWFKARLVVQDNTQLYGIDYKRYESLRLLLALTTILGPHLHQMDVSTAFLNGVLSESICMQQPLEF